jgi:hydrogenase maturation protein HypF
MTLASGAGRVARRIHVRGVVQGVGFRPYVFRLAQAHALSGWVLNGQDGVRIHVEGDQRSVDAFVRELSTQPPPASWIAAMDVAPDAVAARNGFEILDSDADGRPATRISPDLSICADCRREMQDISNRRHRYAYINCTNCGPRYSILHALPYDRVNTTMAEWPLCDACAVEYRNPLDRRFHAEPIACPACGPQYYLVRSEPETVRAGRTVTGDDAIREAAALLAHGLIVALKGVGGYHLACDAANGAAVAALRNRKFRKDKAFALMVRDISTAEQTVVLTPDARMLLESPVRPIVLAPARMSFAHVAPDNRDLGVMLPYAPLHHLLFASGSPARLVMTSGNRSSEPIAYQEGEALKRLHGLADVFLMGERPIARRIDDSVVRATPLGPAVLRRSRGLAPGAAATLPAGPPTLALGADLKNTVTLVVDRQAYVSQHIGDLSDRDSLQAFDETVHDLLAMYGVAATDLLVVHDLHPQYASTEYAASMAASQVRAVQHHRAHVASVLAERGAVDRRVLGVAFDGAGYGDDGAIWGGEFFVGSVRQGFERVAYVRRALLAGGDAAARHPVQAAAGFLAQLDVAVDLAAPPFCFPARYQQARAVIRSGLRTFPTTSAGRLFDTVAALAGFTRATTFEGQAAMWLEHLAREAEDDPLHFPVTFSGSEIDWRDMVSAIVDARWRGTPPQVLARAFHRSLAQGIANTICALTDAAGLDTVVLSGGVMQNDLLLDDVCTALAPSAIDIWINRIVPANDGGVSLGQAALALQPATGT